MTGRRTEVDIFLATLQVIMAVVLGIAIIRAFVAIEISFTNEDKIEQLQEWAEIVRKHSARQDASIARMLQDIDNLSKRINKSTPTNKDEL